MIIMALDLGVARTGVAVCDSMELLASPVCVISQRNEKRLLEQIDAEVKRLTPELIVVGLPRNMDGSSGERAQECERIAALIEQRCGVPVKLWDERSTTVIAHNALNATNTRGKKRKAVIDAVAAVVILQSYLDFRKN